MKRVIFGLVIGLMFTPVVSEAKIANKKKGSPPATGHSYLLVSRGCTESKHELKLHLIDQATGNFRQFDYVEHFCTKKELRPEVKLPAVVVRKDGCELIWRSGNHPGVNPNDILKCGEQNFIVLHRRFITVSSVPEIVRAPKGKLTCRKGTPQFIEASYRPYSPELHTKDAQERGLRFVSKTIRQGFEQVRTITSRAMPGKTLNELTSAQLLLWLLSSEQMDHEEFFAAQASGTFAELAGKFFVKVSLNEETTGHYNLSTAEAYGLHQFMCTTYVHVLTHYPELRLIPHFAEGMRDLVNASKAMLALLDDDFAHEWSPQARAICNASQEMLERCWAVSYNGGAFRVNQVTERWGKMWHLRYGIDGTRIIRPQEEQNQKKGKRFFGLRDQTIIYLAKLAELRKLPLTADAL